MRAVAFRSVVCVIAAAALAGGASGDDQLGFYEAEAQAIARAVDRVADSVVQIEIVGVAQTGGGEIAPDAPSAGTIVDPSGYILASSMVTARPAASILVVLPDKTHLPATVVSEDTGRELVLLKVDPPAPLTAIEVDPAERPRVGQYAIAVGRIRPEGPPARSIGIISALSRLDGRALQTDARISPPFYGGPLLGIEGDFIGIVVPAMPEQGGTGDKSAWYDSGIAFVAPADQIAERLERMKQGESIHPGKLGIVAGNSDPLADGTEIAAVRIGSPAAEAGIEPGDVIESVNGVAVERHADIKQLLGPLDAGTTVAIELKRDDMSMTVSPTLVAEIPPFDPQTLGILVEREGESLAVSAVFPDSPAEQAGLAVGDVITMVNGRAVTELDDLRKRVMTARGDAEVSVVIRRDGEEQTLAIQPTSIAGALAMDLPALPGDEFDAAWTISELTLPDVPNKAAMVAPAEASQDTPLGLLVIFAPPGVENAGEALESWKTIAQQSHVIVAILTASDAQRWNPEEADLGGRVAAMVRKRFTIQPHATAATGEGAGGSIAMIATFADPTTFSGVAVAADVKPPAIQLRENDPTSPIHLMIRGGEDRPGWAELLDSAGYAIIDGPADDDALPRFVWVMGRI